ncbi:hypothetical protein PRIPAC_91046 [Pristionchus pacificus]|uniref:Uncharacterized protein n=1 Tax=Pristionchus pacificus TaxID=54126 RepID=A0A2A6B958_PRIPA|nr:hypothetical protein PRIPAC_91046 [Pristionchus pacificus]|eukprot:PDM62401.1 hypothetical protein PRIPAC_51843 [Pristionchus pacificus]
MHQVATGAEMYCIVSKITRNASALEREESSTTIMGATWSSTSERDYEQKLRDTEELDTARSENALPRECALNKLQYFECLLDLGDGRVLVDDQILANAAEQEADDGVLVADHGHNLSFSQWSVLPSAVEKIDLKL